MEFALSFQVEDKSVRGSMYDQEIIFFRTQNDLFNWHFVFRSILKKWFDFVRNSSIFLNNSCTRRVFLGSTF